MKKIEIFFKKILLFLLIRLNKPIKKSEKVILTNDSKILFVRLNRIGDALVTTPLIYEIKKQVNCKVYILADANNYFVFDNPNLADELFIFEKGFFPMLELIRKVNSLNLDAIIDLHDDVSTTVSYLLAYAKVPTKIGLEKPNKKLYSHVVNKLDPSKNHVIDRLMNISSVFNIKVDTKDINIKFFPNADSEVKAKNFVKLHYPNKRFLLGINISAGSDARFWGIENFRMLCDACKKYPIDLMILSSTKDLRSAFQIIHDKSKVFYSPSFDEFCSIISQVDMLFSPDTATIHLASMYQKPVFGLYVQFETNDIIWYPYKSDFDCIVTKEPNLYNIEFDTVFNKFSPFLEKHLKQINN